MQIGIIFWAIWNQSDDQNFLHSRIKEDFSGLFLFVRIENGGTNFKRGLTSVKADSSKTIIGEVSAILYKIDQFRNIFAKYSGSGSNGSAWIDDVNFLLKEMVLQCPVSLIKSRSEIRLNLAVGLSQSLGDLEGFFFEHIPI